MSKKARRKLALLNDPRQKNRFLEALNKDTMDAAAPAGGGDQELKVLKEMENLDQEHDKYMQDLRSGTHSDRSGGPTAS
jgi:hypothetical protein